jgi:hypothetical protein
MKGCDWLMDRAGRANTNAGRMRIVRVSILDAQDESLRVRSK